MTYQEYLKSQHWLDLRQRVLSYWGNRCACCYSEGALEVHHRCYDRLGFELFTDVIPLCATCHDRLIMINPKKQQLDLFVQNAILSMYEGVVWDG